MSYYGPPGGDDRGRSGGGGGGGGGDYHNQGHNRGGHPSSDDRGPGGPRGRGEGGGGGRGPPGNDQRNYQGNDGYGGGGGGGRFEDQPRSGYGDSHGGGGGGGHLDRGGNNQESDGHGRDRHGHGHGDDGYNGNRHNGHGHGQDDRDHRDRGHAHEYGHGHGRGGGGGVEPPRRYDDRNRDQQRYGERDDRDRDGYRQSGGGGGGGGRERDPYSRDRHDDRGNDRDGRGGGGGNGGGGGDGRRHNEEPPRRNDDRGGRFGGNGGGGGGGDYGRPSGNGWGEDRSRGPPPQRQYPNSNVGPPHRNGGGGFGDRGGRGGGGRGDFASRGRGGDSNSKGGQFRGKSVAVDFGATEANANIVCASVMNNFRFYHYGIDGSDRNGKLIDSRRRKNELFRLGIFDEEKGLLASNGMSKKEIEDFRRVTFFEGSFMYCNRPLPFAKKAPFSLVGRKTPDSDNTPLSDNGDTMTITSLNIYTAPDQLRKNVKTSGPDGIVVDLRCGDCTQAFKTKEAMLSHCSAGGHQPQMDLEEGVKAATSEQFLGFCNVALQRAMGERMARWGREYIDPKNWTEPVDNKHGRSMGVRIFRAFCCEFGIHRPLGGDSTLTLTVDLRAKVIRTKSLLDNLCNGADPHSKRFDRHEMMQANRQFQSEIVICTYDKKCYSVINLDFENSPSSLPVDGTGMSHAQYFAQRKGIELQYPDCSPIVAVLGRGNRTIYLPAELVCANELDPQVKQKLPMIASFVPSLRNDAIEEMRKYLVPGAQKTKGVGGGLLPALGIILEDSRMKVDVEVLPLPLLKAAGVQIPKEKANMWAPVINRANYKVDSGKAVEMNVVVIHHNSLTNSALQVYEKVRNLVNGHNSHYRFGDEPFALVSAGDNENHWRPVEDYMRRQLPENIFVLDLAKPARRQALDAAYSVVKYLLTKNGYLSQFLNFNTHDHSRAHDQRATRKSLTILQGLARQILSKCGARVWWVKLPKEIPLPAVFIGVDVFHSPRKYNVSKGKKTAKESVAAVIVQVVRSHNEEDNHHTEVFSQTFRREVGKEMGLSIPMRETVQNALRIFNVNPMSCFVWRDGVGDPAIKQVAGEEIPAIREAIRSRTDAEVPLSYVVVQKRISTKFLSLDGKKAIPLGSLVVGLQGPKYSTFYINGTAPPYSTPKPARFIIANMDNETDKSARTIAELSWALCHDYSNWTGAIKLPSPVQMAHKLAELAGMMENGGEDIAYEKFAGKAHFL